MTATLAAWLHLISSQYSYCTGDIGARDSSQWTVCTQCTASSSSSSDTRWRQCQCHGWHCPPAAQVFIQQSYNNTDQCPSCQQIHWRSSTDTVSSILQTLFLCILIISERERPEWIIDKDITATYLFTNMYKNICRAQSFLIFSCESNFRNVIECPTFSQYYAIIAIIVYIATSKHCLYAKVVVFCKSDLVCEMILTIYVRVDMINVLYWLPDHQ